MSHATLLSLDNNKLMKDNIKKNIWDIIANVDTIFTVDFHEPLTAKEAVTLFTNENENMDVIDENQICVIEVIDIN